MVLPGPRGERVLSRGVADTYSTQLVQVGVGDGAYSFYAAHPSPLTPAERDRVLVRPLRSAVTREHAPAMASEFQPISHIALDITDNCNLRCPFCVVDYADVRRTNLMSEATFRSALRLIPYVTAGNFWLSCLHERPCTCGWSSSSAWWGSSGATSCSSPPTWRGGWGGTTSPSWPAPACTT